MEFLLSPHLLPLVPLSARWSGTACHWDGHRIGTLHYGSKQLENGTSILSIFHEVRSETLSGAERASKASSWEQANERALRAN